MNSADIYANYHRAVKYTLAGRLKDAFTLTRRLMGDEPDDLMVNKLWFLEDGYKRAGKYAYEQQQDPERDKILLQIKKDLLEILDNLYFLRRDISDSLKEKKYLLEVINIREQKDADKMIEDFSFSREIGSVLKEQQLHMDGQPVSTTDLFYYFLLKGKLDPSEVYFFEKLLNSETLLWYEEVQLVSAVTMSLLNGFDVEKFQVLHLFFKQQKQGVWQRALTGLVLGFYLYDQRILFYPKASAIRFQLAEAGLDKEIEHIIIQLIRARDTEKVSKKMQEEIIPEMIKLRPRLEDKLGLENLLKEDELEDKNPEWETFFKDTPGLAEKMEEFSKMQMEGADVFISAFSMLKHFSFFQELSNWFLPFYAENNVAQAAVSQEVNLNDKQGFLEGFEKSVFLCDSDKYSFILNLQQLPEQQKKMMFEMLEAELNQMNELSKQEALSDGVSQNKSIYISHIQNLYRFCKLYPGRRDFEDIFKLSLDVHNSESFSAMVNDPSVIRNIAEFYFEQGHFHDANDIYKKLIDQGEHDAELYEKIGYSCMKQENYEEAIVFFERAELFESNRVWNLRKLALCNRKLKRFDKAIRNYQDALKLEPENTDLQVSLALTYLQIKDFKSALQYYQQLAESYPDNPRFKRPAAWCALNLGAIDLAGSYYEALLASQQNRFDLMNLGHVYWLKGDVRKALQLYVDSIHTEGNSLKAFLIGFEDDKAILKKQGIKAEEISILMDYMRYELL